MNNDYSSYKSEKDFIMDYYYSIKIHNYAVFIIKCLQRIVVTCWTMVDLWTKSNLYIVFAISNSIQFFVD